MLNQSCPRARTSSASCAMRSPAAALSAIGRPLELDRDLLVGSGRGRGQMPGPAVGIELAICRLGQRQMDRLSGRVASCSCFEDGYCCAMARYRHPSVESASGGERRYGLAAPTRPLQAPTARRRAGRARDSKPPAIAARHCPGWFPGLVERDSGGSQMAPATYIASASCRLAGTDGSRAASRGHCDARGVGDGFQRGQDDLGDGVWLRDHDHV
jgi:hypothetical protein